MCDFFDAKSEVSFTTPTIFQRSWKTALNWLDELFVRHIPVDSIKEMEQKEEIYFFGALAYILAISIYVLLTVRFFKIVVNQAYISLDNSSGTCFTIPISITDSFLADSKGHWTGMFGFEYYDAMYSLQLSGFNISSVQQYNQMMNSFHMQLQSVGKRARSRNLAHNLLLWTNFLSYYSLELPSTQNISALSQGKLQSFQMTGQPKQVFDLRFQIVTAASKFGFCYAATSAVFSKLDGVISSSLALPPPSSSPSPPPLEPSCISIQPSLSPSTTTYLSVGLEVESFTTAMAANIGILKKHHLTIAQNLGRSIRVTYNNSVLTFEVNEYFDLRYPTMTPVICLSNTTRLPMVLSQLSLLCFVVVSASSSIALPVFNHMGYNLTHPSYCECDENTTTTTQAMKSACNKFNLLSGLVLFSDDIEQAFSRVQLENNLFRNVKRLLYMVLHYKDYESFNRAAYVAMAASAIAGDTADEIVSTNSASKFLDSAFNFCDLSTSVLSSFIIHTTVVGSSNISSDHYSTFENNTTSGGGTGYYNSDHHCVLLLFHSFDNFSNQVSNYHFPLRDGSCSDSFNLDDEKWQQLLHDAPVKFYESYFSCLPDQLTALQMASGSAWSNLSLVLPFMVFACVPVLRILLRRWSCLPSPESSVLSSPPSLSPAEYSKDEIQRAGKMLALQLLRCRDGLQLKKVESIGHMELWEQLLDEMKRVHNCTRRKPSSVDVRASKKVHCEVGDSGLQQIHHRRRRIIPHHHIHGPGAGIRVLGLHRKTFTQSTDTGEPDSDEDLEGLQGL